MKSSASARASSVWLRADSMLPCNSTTAGPRTACQKPMRVPSAEVTEPWVISNCVMPR